MRRRNLPPRTADQTTGRVAVEHVQGSAQNRQRLVFAQGYERPAWAASRYLRKRGADAPLDRDEPRLHATAGIGSHILAAPFRWLWSQIRAMKPIALRLELDCSAEEAALFQDAIAFCDRRRTDPQLRPGPALDRAFGGTAERVLGSIADDIDDFGINCRYDAASGKLAITDRGGAPNLGALPLLLVQLFAGKLPIPYRLSRPGSTNPPIWNAISEDRFLVTDDPERLRQELAASPSSRTAKPRGRAR